jgi:hypothetical protein
LVVSVLRHVTASFALIVTVPGENPERLICTVAVAVGALAAGAAAMTATAAAVPKMSLRMLETPSVGVRVSVPLSTRVAR